MPESKQKNEKTKKSSQSLTSEAGERKGAENSDNSDAVKNKENSRLEAAFLRDRGLRDEFNLWLREDSSKSERSSEKENLRLRFRDSRESGQGGSESSK